MADKHNFEKASSKLEKENEETKKLMKIGIDIAPPVYFCMFLYLFIFVDQNCNYLLFIKALLNQTQNQKKNVYYMLWNV